MVVMQIRTNGKIAAFRFNWEQLLIWFTVGLHNTSAWQKGQCATKQGGSSDQEWYRREQDQLWWQ